MILQHPFLSFKTTNCVRLAVACARSLIRKSSRGEARAWGAAILLSATVAVTSCSKPPPPPESPPVPEVTPVPPATPHPATGARESAVKLYPDLAVPGSTFNRTFLELFEDQRKSNPNILSNPEWPLTLARRSAGILGVVPYTPPPAATPTPIPAPPPPTPTPTPNALERGAYNQRGWRASYWIDQYGVRHYYTVPVPAK